MQQFKVYSVLCASEKTSGAVGNQTKIEAAG